MTENLKLIFDNIRKNYSSFSDFEAVVDSKNFVKLVYSRNPKYYIVFQTTDSLTGYLLRYQGNSSELWTGENSTDLQKDIDNLLGTLTKDLYLTESQNLSEKSLFNSLSSQIKKTIKAIDKQLSEFESAIPSIKSTSEKLLNDIGGESVFRKSILSFSSENLKKITQAKASVELALGLETVKAELEKAKEILTDPEYLDFCKTVDDNTSLFGKDKGKLTAIGADGKAIGVTSKTAGGIVDKNKKGNFDAQKAHKDSLQKKESVLQEIGKKKEPKDVTADLEKFRKASEQLSQALANASQITEMLQNDPVMQKAAKEADVNFARILGVLAITGGICKIIGNVVPGLGLIGTALASGSVLAKSAKSVVNTVKNPNMSVGQKLLRMAPSVAAASFATMGLSKVANNLSAGLDSASSDLSLDSDSSSNVADSEDITNNATGTVEDSSDIESTTGEETTVEPTVENSIAAQADAEPGDVLRRSDGTLVTLNKGDIEWAKNMLKAAESGEANTGNLEIDSQDLGDARVEDIDDNPVLNDETHEIETPTETDATEETTSEESNDVVSDDSSEEITSSEVGNAEDSSEDATVTNAEEDSAEDSTDSEDENTVPVEQTSEESAVADDQVDTDSSETEADTETENEPDAENKTDATTNEDNAEEDTEENKTDSSENSNTDTAIASSEIPDETDSTISPDYSKLSNAQRAKMFEAADAKLQVENYGSDYCSFVAPDESEVYVQPITIEGEDYRVIYSDSEQPIVCNLKGEIVFENGKTCEGYDLGIRDKDMLKFLNENQPTESDKVYCNFIHGDAYVEATGIMDKGIVDVGEIKSLGDGIECTRLSNGKYLVVDPEKRYFEIMDSKAKETVTWGKVQEVETKDGSTTVQYTKVGGQYSNNVNNEIVKALAMICK